MDSNFINDLINRKFDEKTQNELMGKISNWNKIQEYFDSKPELTEIINCLAVELQTKGRSVICKRLHQRIENIQRGSRAKEIGNYIKKNKKKAA